MTISSETSALQKFSSVDRHVDGRYIYSRAFTPQYAQELRRELGGYACQALGFIPCEGDRRVMMKRAPAQALMLLEGLPLNVEQRGLAV